VSEPPKSALPWLLAGALALSCAGHLATLRAADPGLATLPIFVPTSLAYEQAMRAERGQPAARGGQEAMEIARALLESGDLPEDDPALAAQIAQVRDTRAALLEVRNRRHALNIALMNVGVAITRELDTEQWDQIHMNRDILRTSTEMDIYARLLERLR
jgi:hypothetical protein